MAIGDYEQITLAKLATIDCKRIAIAFDQAIRNLATDCDDRPGDKRARKVVLQVELTPMPDESGVADEVAMKVQIKESLPTRKSKDYSLSLRKNGVLAIREGSEDNHEQSPLPFPEDD